VAIIDRQSQGRRIGRNSNLCVLEPSRAPTWSGWLISWITFFFFFPLSLSLIVAPNPDRKSIYVLHSMSSVEVMTWCDSLKKSRLKGSMLASGLDLSLRVNGLMGTFIYIYYSHPIDATV
jgi:hypothetical protein